RLRGALARVVVGRRTDAAEAEHRIARGRGGAQLGDDALGIVADVVRPRECQAARFQRGDEAREMLVLAPAGEDLVADDEGAEVHGVVRSVGPGESPRWSAGISFGRGGSSLSDIAGCAAFMRASARRSSSSAVSA